MLKSFWRSIKPHQKQARQIADTRDYVLYPGGRRCAIFPRMTATLPSDTAVQGQALVALVTDAVLWSPWEGFEVFDRVPEVDNLCHIRLRVGLVAQRAVPTVVLVEYHWLDRHTNAVVAVHVSTHTWAVFREKIYSPSLQDSKALSAVRGLIRTALDSLAGHLGDTQKALDALM